MLHQKRSELLRLSIIIALLAVSVGIILVQSAKVDTSSQQSNPIFAKVSTNSSVNFTIAVSAGSNTVRYVGINKPASYSDLNCANLLPIDSAGNAWTCTEVTSSLVKYTSNDGLTTGNSLQVKINATSGAASGNVSFTINTFEDASGTVAQNNTIVNVTVDGQAPVISALNLTSGNLVLAVVANLTNNTFVAKNNLVIAADVISNLAPTASGEVAVYFNVTNTSNPLEEIPHSRTAGTFLAQLQMSTTDTIDESTGRFNATIPSTFLSNGSIVTFVIVANDTVGNENVTNTSFIGVSSPIVGFNVTVDDAAPTAKAPGVAGVKILDDSFDVAADNITTSSQAHNFSVDVIDHGGSGIYSVWINVSGALTLMTARGADNLYNASGSIQSLGGSAGDQNLTIYFVTNDSVGNINLQALSFNLLVDDPDFITSVAIVNTTTMRFNFTTSNATIVNITAAINANINSTQGSNVTIHGPNGPRYNMTLMTTTTKWPGVGLATQLVYQSTWFSSVQPSLNMTGGLPNNVSGTTWSNLSDFGCNIPTGDGDTCPIQITWTDIFGRQNSTNITITVDGVAPFAVNSTVFNFTDLTPGSKVTKSTAILNITVNAQNNLENVTVHNASKQGDLLNVTAMSAGGERNFSVQMLAGALCAKEGPCDINFTLTDQALTVVNNNASTTIIIDDTPPAVSDNGNFLFGVRIGNRTGLDTSQQVAANITGTEDAISRGSTLISGGAVVKLNAYLNFSLNASDATSNITLLTAGNSSNMNFSRQGETAAAGSIWVAQNYSYELCGFGATDLVETDCILRFTAKDNVSNTNSSVTLTLRMDSLAPRVDSLTTDLSLKHRVGGITNRVNFSVNVTDANLGAFNVTIGNTSTVFMNSTSGSSTSNSTVVMYSVSTTLADLGCSENANCSIRVYANDSVNNINDSVSISVLSDASGLTIKNLTVASSLTFKTSNPNVYVNTSSPAQCRYSTDQTNYSDMTSQFDSEGTTSSYFSPSNLLDKEHTYHVSCVDLDGDNVANGDVGFTVDTTSLWNITIGATGALSAKADYFWNANKWYSTAMLANTNILTTTSHNNAADTYNVTNVLASLVSANPSGATNNLSVMFAHNTVANTWTSYIPGDQAGNDFLNFTSDVTTYYFNLSQGNERLEIG